MIGLVDGNNFFVSCERIFDLSLRGKPVAVLSNNDGCVISRSNEFKALNIPMGTPYFQLRDRKDLILRSSNYEFYGDISRRVIRVLYEFSPDVEQYSIDEAFIHVNLPGQGDYFEFGKRVRNTVLQWVGIPCGVGFASSRTLAKIANHIGKKAPDGVFVMPEDSRNVLENIPVSEVWGVGRRLAPKLSALGIRSAWQLASSDEVWMQKKFNVTLVRTIRELRGESVIEHGDPEEAVRSVTCSRSFGKPVLLLSELEEAVAHYIARAAAKLRAEKSLAAGVNVYFQYYPEYAPYPREGGIRSATVVFDKPSNNTGDIISAVSPKLKSIFTDGRRYKKAGVVFFGLESARIQQLDMFADTAADERSSRLSETLDAINKKFGRGSLFHLAEGIEKGWSMKRGMLSRGYTTNWDELPEVK